MRKLKALSALLLMLSFLFINTSNARTLEEISNSGVLNVVTSASNPPGGFIDPRTNTLQGVMVDIANAIASHLEIKAEFTNVPFSGLIASLRSGRIVYRASLWLGGRGNSRRRV